MCSAERTQTSGERESEKLVRPDSFSRTLRRERRMNNATEGRRKVFLKEIRERQLNKCFPSIIREGGLEIKKRGVKLSWQTFTGTFFK